MDNIVMAVEEIGMDGSVSLGKCSKSTLYRWRKAINEYLERNHFDWRVRADVKDMSLTLVGVEPQRG